MEDDFLPLELRDFKKQKEFFQEVYKDYGDFLEGLDPAMQNNLFCFDWVDLNVLTVDFVLWHFAQKGYVLTKKEKNNGINKEER